MAHPSRIAFVLLLTVPTVASAEPIVSGVGRSGSQETEVLMSLLAVRFIWLVVAEGSVPPRKSPYRTNW